MIRGSPALVQIDMTQTFTFSSSSLVLPAAHFIIIDHADMLIDALS